MFRTAPKARTGGGFSLEFQQRTRRAKTALPPPMPEARKPKFMESLVERASQIEEHSSTCVQPVSPDSPRPHSGAQTARTTTKLTINLPALVGPWPHVPDSPGRPMCSPPRSASPRNPARTRETAVGNLLSGTNSAAAFATPGVQFTSADGRERVVLGTCTNGEALRAAYATLAHAAAHDAADPGTHTPPDPAQAASGAVSAVCTSRESVEAEARRKRAVLDVKLPADAPLAHSFPTAKPRVAPKAESALSTPRSPRQPSTPRTPRSPPQAFTPAQVPFPSMRHARHLQGVAAQPQAMPRKSLHPPEARDVSALGKVSNFSIRPFVRDPLLAHRFGTKAAWRASPDFLPHQRLTPICPLDVQKKTRIPP